MRAMESLTLGIMAGLPALACSEPPPPAPARTNESAVAKMDEASKMDEAGRGEGVADLPYARGRRFRTLDDYLAHLRQNGAIDLPWWREVAPGVYELQTSMRTLDGQRPERATREELMRRFGFTR